MTASDVVVVGGGVIGLSIAYVLSGQGATVTLADRGPFGREASWAGAGIISPGSEVATNHPAAQMRTLAARLHAEWSAALRDATGIDNGFRVCGGVDVALDDAHAHELRAAAGRWRDEGISFEDLAPADIHRVEPALGPSVRKAYFLPDRAQIRNPRHLQALISACRIQGVDLRPGSAVEGFVGDEERLVGVRFRDQVLSCGAVVVAAGAWTSMLLEGVGVPVLTPPVRGQIVLLRSDRPMLRRIVEQGKRYLVPRDDGRVLVGSTEELAGFAPQNTPEGVAGLIALAHQLCPVLQEAEVERTWAGLRPGSIDTRPYLGRAGRFANLFVASGHQRAGLQLSPASAVLMADLVRGRPTSIDLESYRVDRPAGVALDDAFRS